MPKIALGDVFEDYLKEHPKESTEGIRRILTLADDTDTLREALCNTATRLAGYYATYANNVVSFGSGVDPANTSALLDLTRDHVRLEQKMLQLGSLTYLLLGAGVWETIRDIFEPRMTTERRRVAEQKIAEEEKVKARVEADLQQQEAWRAAHVKASRDETWP